MDAVACDFRIALENAHRGVSGHDVRRPAANVMIGTRVLEKPMDDLGVTLLDAQGRVCIEPTFKVAPSGQTVLPRKGVLNVAERWD
jgi:hypothetical protein